MLTALVIAVLLRTFLVQVFFIPSSSMVPTLAVDDRIVVEKVTYRFREPQRGDVVVFTGADGSPVTGDGPLIRRALDGLGRLTGVIPPDPSDLVKRVVALPGEEVAIIDGVLHVDGVALDEPYVAAPVPADFDAITVPVGTLFFLGDNRRNSADSRGSLGFVTRERVVGRALAVVWPPGNARSLVGQQPQPRSQSDSAESVSP